MPGTSDLLAVGEWGGEVHERGVRFPRETAGRGDGVGDPRPRREVVEPWAGYGAGDVDDDESRRRHARVRRGAQRHDDRRRAAAMREPRREQDDRGRDDDAGRQQTAMRARELHPAIVPGKPSRTARGCVSISTHALCRKLELGTSCAATTGGSTFG